MRLFLRDRHFYTTLVALAAPVALQNILTVAVSVADTLMIGQLGETHLSAVSLANQLWTLLMVVSFGINGGASVLLSQYWGRRDTETMRRVEVMALKLVVMLSLVFLVISQLWGESFMSFFSREPQVIVLGASYLRIVGWSYPLYAVANLSVMMLRNWGKVNISMVVYLASLMTNVTLNYALIFGNWGAPRLGVQGGALATAIARGVEFLIVVTYVFLLEKDVRLRLQNFLGSNRPLYRKYWRESIPIIANEVIWAAGSAMVTMVIGRMGEVFVSANSIYLVLMQLVSVAIIGVSSAALTVVGNTIGAGDLMRAKQISFTLQILSLGLGVASAGLSVLLCPALLTFYPNLERETVELVWSLTLVGTVGMGFRGISMVGMMGILRAGGDGRFVLMLEGIFMWFVAVPAGLYTGLVLGWPAPVVFFLLRSDEILKSIVASVRILRFRWLRDVTREERENYG